MTSRTKGNNHDNGDERGGDVRKKLINKAIRYARTSRQDRRIMRALLALLEHQALGEEEHERDTPPLAFVQALRKPKSAKRETITVAIEGVRVPILLNPQGKADPERELWLWTYVRSLVREARDE